MRPEAAQTSVGDGHLRVEGERKEDAAGGWSSESSENYRWNRFHSSYRPSRRDLQGTIEEVLVTTRCLVVSIMASSGARGLRDEDASSTLARERLEQLLSHT